MTEVSAVPLGEVLVPHRDEVFLEPHETYRTAGIYSFGRGMFEREPVKGGETAYTSLFRLHTDQFVVSRLNGWEGAVDVVAPPLDGCLVSNEYPTFDIRGGRAEPAYLRWIARWPAFWDALVPRGSMVRRKRVQPAQLLEVEIPLPLVDEQRRVAAKLDEWHETTGSLLDRFTRHNTSAGTVPSRLPSLIDGVLQRTSDGTIRVGELVDFVNDTVHPGEDPAPARTFVGLQHVESNTGRRLGSSPIGDEKGRKFRFRPGDVVYGYLRPYLNKVWVADRDGLCSVDQYVLRPKPGVSAELLGHQLRSANVLQQAKEMTHRLQLPRLRSGFLADTQVHAIPRARRDDVLRQVENIRSHCIALADARERQFRTAQALMPSVLNQVFGELR